MKTDLSALRTNAHATAEKLKALAHGTRLLGLCYLGEREMSVQELETVLGTTQSNLSQHLAKLRDRGILACRREGNRVYAKPVEKGQAVKHPLTEEELEAIKQAETSAEANLQKA